MATKRKATTPTTEAIDQFCSQFDDLFNRRAARLALRQYLIGLLLPRERDKALTVLASLITDSTDSGSRRFDRGIGRKSAVTRIVWNETQRRVRRFFCPWAGLRLHWNYWSKAPPPAELAALLDHVAHSKPLPAPT